MTSARDVRGGGPAVATTPVLDGQVAPVVPGLHYWEAANVLRTLVARAELDAELAFEIYHLHLEAPLTVREAARAEVLATSLRFGSTAYDAVYLSLALDSDIQLLTAERRTNSWIVKLGKSVEIVR
jgi:predicted nucleic acid-binding protein